MKRTAASALWLTYYAFVSPLQWVGYWMIELADWIGRRSYERYGTDDNPYDGLTFWLYNRGIDLEAELFERWHSALMKTGFAADMLLSLHVEEDDETIRTWHQLTRYPWQRPFSQRLYRIEHPDTLPPEIGYGEGSDIATKLSTQLV